VRLLVRLDPLERIHWVPSRDRALLPADVDPQVLDQTLVVIQPASGRRWTRSDAFARLLAALPFGGAVAWVLLVPGLRAIARRAYDAFASRRARVSAWLGFAACGIPSALPPPSPGTAGSASPALRRSRRARAELRELGVGLAILILGADTLDGNRAVPEALRWKGRPSWMLSAQQYPRIFESWGLFAPEGPLDDEMVVVDAVTADSRHVDPYNEAASRVHDLPVTEIPTRLGMDSFFCDYTLAIPHEGAYHGGLRDWILRYPERTHRPEDKIVSFEVIRIDQRSPAPGQTTPTSVQRRTFLQWPPP
jgi:predicted DCC family thiol-disulfide oxidoreductase YuxK